jgi:hypothetical protein
MAMTEEEKAERRAARAEQRHIAEMFQIEERARQTEAATARRHAKYEQYERGGLLPTRESLRVGGPPCPGCGKPYIDGAGSWPPPMKITAGELVAQQTMEAEFERVHAECDKQFGRRGWTYEGSRTSHCWECCPFPPMSDSQIEAISRLLAPRDDAWRRTNLNVWRVTLRCGHSVKREVNRDQKQYSPNRYSAPKCPECHEYRAEQSTVLLGLLGELTSNEGTTIAPTPPSKAEVNRERRKLRELERQVTHAKERLAILEQRRAQP